LARPHRHLVTMITVTLILGALTFLVFVDDGPTRR
jgi:hypothetical protein